MQWKVSASFPAYEVSEHGNLRRIGSLDERRSCRTSAGYPSFTLRRNGKTVTITAHSLVAEVFLGPKPFADAEICHKDSDKDNAHYTNLRWDTHQANMADTILGANNPHAKLTENNVIEIRRLGASGIRQSFICKQFDLSKAAVSDIINRKRWKHVA